MALKQQATEIQLNGGLDRKQSVDLANVDSLVLADNLRFNALHQLERRPTYTDQCTEPEASADYNNARQIDAVFASGDQVLALTQHSGVGVCRAGGGDLIMPSAIGWQGTAPKACRVSRRFVLGAEGSAQERGILSSSTSFAADVGVLVTASIVLVTTSQTRLVLRALDAETGAVLAERTGTLGNGLVVFPVVQTVYVPGAGVVCTYSQGSSLGSIAITQSLYDTEAGIFRAPVTLVADSALGAHAANMATDGAYYLTYLSADGPAANVLTVGATSGSVSDVYASDKISTAWSVVQGEAHALLIQSDGAKAYLEVVGDLGTQIELATAPASNAVQSVSGCAQTFYDPSGSEFSVFGVSMQESGAGINARSTQFYRVEHSSGSFLPTAIGARVFGAYLASHGASYEGVPYFVMTLDANESVRSVGWTGSTAISSSFVVRVPLQDDRGPDPVARLCHDRVAVFASQIQTVALTISEDGRLYYGSMADSSPTPIAPYSVTLPQTAFVSSVEFASGQGLPLQSVEHEGAVVVGSGVLFDHDGYSTLESQPLARPRLNPDASGSGDTTATFSITAIYRMVDNAGRLHESAPAAAIAVTAEDNQVDVYVTKPPLTAYGNYGGASARVVDVELYVTQDGGSEYFLALTDSGQKLNYATPGVTTPFFRFVDVKPSDGAAPPIYSTGAGLDELVSEAPPAPLSLARIGDRLWMIDAEDRRRIWFTKPLVAGFAPQWNTANTLFIGEEGVALVDNQGMPTVLSNSGVWVVDGDGPNANGVGNYSPAQRLPVEVQGVCPTSICRVPGGAMFRTLRGMSLLAGASVQAIGLPIDPITATVSRDDLIKCVYDERHNEVRVLDANRGLFVYNLLESKWTSWLQDSDHQNMVDACVAGGRVWYVHNPVSLPWRVRRELGVDEDAYNHSGERWQLTTPWIRLDSLSSFGRLWNTLLALHTFADDAEGIFCQILGNNDPNDSIYSTPWPSMGSVGAIADAVVWLRARPNKQRVSSIRIDLLSANTGGDAFASSIPLTARLEYGVQPGGRRQLDQRAVKG